MTALAESTRSRARAPPRPAGIAVAPVGAVPVGRGTVDVHVAEYLRHLGLPENVEAFGEPEEYLAVVVAESARIRDAFTEILYQAAFVGCHAIDRVSEDLAFAAEALHRPTILGSFSPLVISYRHVLLQEPSP